MSELPETETWILDEFEDEPHTTEVDVSVNTQIKCSKCGGKSYLRDGKCAKCHHGLV